MKLSAVDKRGLKKAHVAVHALLRFRLRSCREVENKLKQKRFSYEIINSTIDYFKDRQILDDRQFTREWITSRLSRPFGLSRIRTELKIKGIDDDIIDEEIERATRHYPEEMIVTQLALKRASQYHNISDEKKRHRVYGYLVRRGFSRQAILKALKELQ